VIGQKDSIATRVIDQHVLNRDILGAIKEDGSSTVNAPIWVFE
jgi:hypothetical protein